MELYHIKNSFREQAFGSELALGQIKLEAHMSPSSQQPVRGCLNDGPCVRLKDIVSVKSVEWFLRDCCSPQNVSVLLFIIL